MDTLSVMKAEDLADSVANTVAVVTGHVKYFLPGPSQRRWVTKFC